MLKNIKNLCSHDAVIAAITECDELGRDNFLAKYSYKRAPQYQRVFDGREYDSKAIAGVAFRKQFGTPLTPYDFIGGAIQCAPVLEQLGFEIRVGVAAEGHSAVSTAEGSKRKASTLSTDFLSNLSKAPFFLRSRYASIARCRRSHQVSESHTTAYRCVGGTH